ncbi:MAG: transcription antitermination factor NusB [Intestinimonas sp.]|jgi:N utilization substance protein B|nr:transcription antitermination factor NusB [Intestinimonas sp.]
MTRTTAREIAVHFSYALALTGQGADELLNSSLSREYFAAIAEEEPLYREFPNEKQKEYISALVHGVDQHGAELDGYISKYAIGWSFSRISRMSAAVMRVAMYEVLYMPDIPAGAAINEAVEIAKHYESPETVSFINGILGAFVRDELPPERKNQPGKVEKT